MKSQETFNMALEKVLKVDLIEVVADGCVQIRVKTSILENGKELNSSFHRRFIRPGEDFCGEDDRVQAICAAVHTPEVISQFRSAQAA